MTKTTQSRADVARARKDKQRLEKAMQVARVLWLEAPSLHRSARHAEYLDAKKAFEEKYPPPPLIG